MSSAEVGRGGEPVSAAGAARGAGDGSGRAAQRRRTRKAIIEATTQLLSAGASPSVNDIAAAADVSRRTIYQYFPTLDQLILDATVGAMTADVETELAHVASDDPRVRLRALVETLSRGMAASLPFGRQLIRLTVEAPAAPTGTPRRGFRRIEWIETAVSPARKQLGKRAYDQLVSALAVVIGWEAYIVLVDIRGLDDRAAMRIMRDTALTLLDAALAA